MSPLDMIGPEIGAPVHHPGEELLFAYAAGSLAEAASLAVATHLALCPHCRAEVRRLESVGGAMLTGMAPAPVGDDVLAGILARIDEEPVRPAVSGTARRRPAMGTPPLLPEPLRSYAGSDLPGIRWAKVIRGVEECAIACNGGTVRLLRIKGGTAMPRHTHGGTELTLVLDGAFADEDGHFRRGDFAATDGSVDHRPIADPGPDCICLAVTDAPLKLTGTFGRLLNPFVKF